MCGGACTQLHAHPPLRCSDRPAAAAAARARSPQPPRAPARPPARRSSRAAATRSCCATTSPGTSSGWPSAWRGLASGSAGVAARRCTRRSPCCSTPAGRPSSCSWSGAGEPPGPAPCAPRGLASRQCWLAGMAACQHAAPARLAAYACMRRPAAFRRPRLLAHTVRPLRRCPARTTAQPRLVPAAPAQGAGGHALHAHPHDDAAPAGARGAVGRRRARAARRPPQGLRPPLLQGGRAVAGGGRGGVRRALRSL